MITAIRISRSAPNRKSKGQPINRPQKQNSVVVALPSSWPSCSSFLKRKGGDQRNRNAREQKGGGRKEGKESEGKEKKERQESRKHRAVR